MSTTIEFLTDTTADALWPRNAEYVVAVVAVIAHPFHQLVPHSCASAAPRGGRACACGAASAAHPAWGATYFDFGGPCYVYRARCSAGHACAASARLCPPKKKRAMDCTSLSEALVLAAGHITLFLPPALHPAPHFCCSCLRASGFGSYFAITSFLRLPLITPRSALCCFGGSRTSRSPFCKVRVGP